MPNETQKKATTCGSTSYITRSPLFVTPFCNKLHYRGPQFVVETGMEKYFEKQNPNLLFLRSWPFGKEGRIIYPFFPHCNAVIN